MNKILNIVMIVLLLICPKLMATDNRVVFIHSYHLQYPWVKEYRDGFLKRMGDYQLVEFEMDTKRQPESAFVEIAERAKLFIAQHQPRVVVLADDNALKLLGPSLIDQNIPFVFLGINSNPRDYIALTDFVSGVLERPLMKRSVAMLKEIKPNLKRVKVLMDNGVTSHAILKTSFDNSLQQSISNIQVKTILTSDFEIWQRHVKQAKKDGFEVLVIANYASMLNQEGAALALNDVSEWTSRNSEIPVFAVWSYSIGKGKAVGGLIISGKEQGLAAADLVNHYYQTGSMKPIFTPKRGAFLFSQSELEKWQLTLPQSLQNAARFRP